MNRRLRNYVLTAAAFLVLVIAITVTNIKPTEAQNTKIGDVRVVNAASDWVAPVPTQARGTTNVVGTVQAQQNGGWNVGISGIPTFNLAPETNIGIRGTPSVGLAPGASVQVNNTEANPVLVRNVDSAGKSVTLVFNSGLVSLSSNNNFKVVGTVDVSDYSQIRVLVSGSCTTGTTKLSVRLTAVEEPLALWKLDEIFPCQGEGDSTTKVIDFPGKMLQVGGRLLEGVSGAMYVVIYGR